MKRAFWLFPFTEHDLKKRPPKSRSHGVKKTAWKINIGKVSPGYLASESHPNGTLKGNSIWDSVGITKCFSIRSEASRETLEVETPLCSLIRSSFHKSVTDTRSTSCQWKKVYQESDGLIRLTRIYYLDMHTSNHHLWLMKMARVVGRWKSLKIFYAYIPSFCHIHNPDVCLIPWRWIFLTV